MSKSNQFRQYAEEAMRSADRSKIQKEKESLHRACPHVDRSCGAERTSFCRQRQSA